MQSSSPWTLASPALNPLDDAHVVSCESFDSVRMISGEASLTSSSHLPYEEKLELAECIYKQEDETY